MITLSFEEVAVDTEKPHFLKMAVHFLGSFTTYSFNQGFTCLYTSARKVPAFKVGMPDEQHLSFSTASSRTPTVTGLIRRQRSR